MSKKIIGILLAVAVVILIVAVSANKPRYRHRPIPETPATPDTVRIPVVVDTTGMRAAYTDSLPAVPPLE